MDNGSAVGWATAVSPPTYSCFSTLACYHGRSRAGKTPKVEEAMDKPIAMHR